MKYLTIFLICIQNLTAELPSKKQNEFQKSVINVNISGEHIKKQDLTKHTMLNGNYSLSCQDTTNRSYVPYMLNYVYSPYIQIPSGDSVLFDFYIRGSFFDDYNDDYWDCQVSPDSGSTWYFISNPFGDSSLVNEIYSNVPLEWSSFVLSFPPDGVLNGYADSNLRFRWCFRSDADNPDGEGIFLDDISLTVDGVLIFFEDFEDANMNDWETVDGTDMPGLWHQTTVNAYIGQSWAMNDPDIGPQGGYDEHWYQTFDSPPAVLPTGQTNTITFMQNRVVEPPYNYPPWDGYDGTNVRISNDGGSSWTILTNTNPIYNCYSLYSFGYEFDEGVGIPGWAGSSNGWEAVTITIPSVYDGQEVIIRFAFASDLGYSTSNHPELIGWIIDDIDIAGVITNDGETVDGWTAESQIPLVGNYWHLAYFGPTSVDPYKPENKTIPITYSLSQNYPNPFNPTTQIKYEIFEKTKVTLKIFDISGREIKVLVNEIQIPGEKFVEWDGKNNLNKIVSSGIYIYQMKTDEMGFNLQSKKMLLLR